MSCDKAGKIESAQVVSWQANKRGSEEAAMKSEMKIVTIIPVSGKVKDIDKQ